MCLKKKREEGASRVTFWVRQWVETGYKNSSTHPCCSHVVLTFNGVVSSKGHLNVIPFQEVAGPSEWLRKHNKLIHTEGEGLHRDRLELQWLVGGKLWKTTISVQTTNLKANREKENVTRLSCHHTWGDAVKGVRQQVVEPLALVHGWAAAVDLIQCGVGVMHPLHQPFQLAVAYQVVAA